MKKFNFIGVVLLLFIAATIVSNILEVVAGEYQIFYICLLCWNSIMFGITLGEILLGNILVKHKCDFSQEGEQIMLEITYNTETIETTYRTEMEDIR